MRDFIESLGGASWAAFSALSVIATVVLAFGLPKLVDTSNPWVVFIACSLVFIVGFFNGWKQRGFRNERDIEYAEGLERERMEIAKGNEAEIARINADKELELDRRNREERERERADAERRIAEERERRVEEMRASLRSLSAGQKALIGRILRSGGVCKLPSKDTDAAMLQSLGVLEDLHVTDATASHWKISATAADALEGDDRLKGEMQAAESANREIELHERFLHADYRDKLLVALLYRTDGISVSRRIFDCCFNRSFMNYSVLDEDMRGVWLTDDMKALLNDRPDTLDFYEPQGDETEWLKDKVREAAGL